VTSYNALETTENETREVPAPHCLQHCTGWFKPSPKLRGSEPFQYCRFGVQISKTRLTVPGDSDPATRLDAGRAVSLGEQASTMQSETSLQGSLSIERMCQLGEVSRAGLYRHF
jgi:hypothetical protein